MSRCRIGRSHGPYHFACRGWKHKEPLGGGPVDRPEWTRPEVGRAEEHGWRHQRMDWFCIRWRGAHGDQFNRASRTNCQPASQPETSRMSGKGANPKGPGAATKHAEARTERAQRGTTPKARLPIPTGPDPCMLAKIRALVTMQLWESSVPGHNLVYQLPSDRRGLLIRDGEALEPFRKVASHHEAVLVPCRGDRVGTGDVNRQLFHRNPDDVLVQRLPSSPTSLQHCAVAFVADPAHVSTHSGPVETLLRQRQGACRAQMGPDHPSMELLEKTAASIRPGRLTGAAIPVPPTHGTVGVAPRLPGITVPTGAIAPWLLVTPARCPPSGAGRSRPASIS